MKEQKPKISRREKEILALLAEGHKSQEVADKLFISKRTVDFHIQNLYEKFPDVQGKRVKLIRVLDGSFGRV